MSRYKWLAILLLSFTILQPSFADDNAKILGAWKLVSYEGPRFKLRAKKCSPWEKPNGLCDLQSRVSFVVCPDGRWTETG